MDGAEERIRGRPVIHQQSESDRVVAVLNALHEGVVSVDPHLGRAHVNEAAAKLLRLPPGAIPVPDFAAAMADLAGRALNGDVAAAANQALQSDPMAEIDSIWRFADPPTHVRVRSLPLHHDGLAGRLWTFSDESDLAQALEDSERSHTLVRATADAMIDPQTVLQTVKDSNGVVVDLRYLDVNRAACDYLNVARDYLLGRSALTDLPNLEGSGLLERYARCAENGEPVVLDDFSYFHEMLDDARRYDVRASQVRPGVLNLTWRDVTERFRTAQRIADSALQYRLLAENSGDVVTRVRDGVIIWASPSIEDAFGAPPAHWIGRPSSSLIPPGGEDGHRERLRRLAAGETLVTRVRLLAADATEHWVHMHAKPFIGDDGRIDGFTASMRLIDGEVRAEQVAAAARARQAAADALYRKSMDSSAIGMCLADTEGAFLEVNPAMCEFFGYPAEVLTTKTWMELTAPDYLQADIDQRAEVTAGRIDSYRMVKQFRHADGRAIWGDLSVGCIRTPDGQVEVFIGQITDITAEVQARRELEEARARQAEADARYRRLMSNSNVGMCLVTPDGRFDVVNPALCEFFGYDETTLRALTWQELTAAEYLDADLEKVEDVLAGRIDSYRMTKQFIHADGHLIWGDLSVSCLRNATGAVERFVSQITDITAEVEGRHRLAERDRQNQVLARRLRSQTDRLKSELNSAAQYVTTILPGDLDGAVRVSSRYLPSRELGGDIYDYGWIDDDHLMVYLIDVSGHGVAPALMSVSVYNMLRTESLPRRLLLAPDLLLAELNRRFAMEQQDGHYFTVWYGVYQRSTRTLRYASAGHPPALVFGGTGEPAVELATDALPVGMFDDTAFRAGSVAVPVGARLLIYSDGAYELPLKTALPWGRADFVALCRDQAAARWSLDDLVSALRARTAAGLFEDDCSLVLVSFD